MVRAVRVAMFISALALPASARADLFVPGNIPATCIATPCIDVGGFGDAIGTISYAGGQAPLVGSDLLVRRVWGFNTPQNATILGLPIAAGQLNFTTGPFMSFDPIGGYWFSGGGSFTITGGIPDIGIPLNSVLARGTFRNAFLWPGVAPFIFGPSGDDWKNPVLATHFGFAPGTPFKFGGPSLTMPPDNFLTGGPFSLKVVVLDVPNTPHPVPEPASMLLLGSGLAVAGWRKLRRS